MKENLEITNVEYDHEHEEVVVEYEYDLEMESINYSGSIHSDSYDYYESSNEHVKDYDTYDYADIVEEFLNENEELKRKYVSKDIEYKLDALLYSDKPIGAYIEYLDWYINDIYIDYRLN